MTFLQKILTGPLFVGCWTFLLEILRDVVRAVCWMINLFWWWGNRESDDAPPMMQALGLFIAILGLALIVATLVVGVFFPELHWWMRPLILAFVALGMLVGFFTLYPKYDNWVWRFFGWPAMVLHWVWKEHLPIPTTVCGWVMGVIGILTECIFIVQWLSLLKVGKGLEQISLLFLVVTFIVWLFWTFTKEDEHPVQQ